MDSGEYVRYREPIKCFIPQCRNNDVKNPSIVFITIRKELKERWCQIINRNCPKRTLHSCQAHLNLEEDLENYEEWMSDRTRRPILKLNTILKNIPKAVVIKEKENQQLRDYEMSVQPTASTSCEIQTVTKINVATQITEIKHNKDVMAKPATKDAGTNFRARKLNEKVLPSLSSIEADSEETPSQTLSHSGTSNQDSFSSNTQSEHKVGRDFLLKLIKNKPKMYLGLPKNYWWVIDFFAQELSCLPFHIIITLFKIKNNDTFVRMSEEFEIARSSLKTIFEKNLQVLATYFQNFIYLPSPIENKKNLPLVFKIRYSDVLCIIDCFEIQIEKPTNPVRQAQTWSSYKSCNTVKYLIGCTPAGLICFISKGFGGRISDKAITEKSCFVNILPTNATIMADRGFKEIEAILTAKNVKILRPPSVYANEKLTKEEVVKAKVIASLRVHVERVIRRIREFHMLKPHSVVNHKHVKYLDGIVITACGLINLQEQIINEN